MAINNGYSLPLLVCVVVTVCVVAPLAEAKDTEVVYCDKKTDYDVKISGVEINPYPVKRGKSATFSISASTDKSLSGGTLKIDVAYFGLYIHSESHELCQETSCPATGDFVISHSQTLPGITPPGSYTLKLTLEDGNKQLTCINFDFSIGWWFAEAKAVADI